MRSFLLGMALLIPAPLLCSGCSKTDSNPQIKDQKPPTLEQKVPGGGGKVNPKPNVS